MIRLFGLLSIEQRWNSTIAISSRCCIHYNFFFSYFLFFFFFVFLFVCFFFSIYLYLCAIGMSFSPAPSAGKGASTVSTPSLLRDDLMVSGFVPFGRRNSRLYSLYTDFVSDFSSCLAWTWKSWKLKGLLSEKSKLDYIIKMVKINFY